MEESKELQFFYKTIHDKNIYDNDSVSLQATERHYPYIRYTSPYAISVQRVT